MRPGQIHRAWHTDPVRISIEDLERAAAPGWRGPEEERLGGWLLRAADGFTGRANSALAAGDPGVPLKAAIETVCGWYSSRSLPAMIAIPFPAGNPRANLLERVLAERGWTVRAGAATVMTAEPGRLTAGPHPKTAAGPMVDVDAEPDDGWLARYHYRGQQLPPIALRVLTSAPWQAFGSVRADGQTIAIGRVALAGGWAGLTAIEVDPRHRRQGLATAITRALVLSAAGRGATGVYLQVEDDNAAARALYHRAGFTDHHGYHYRIAPSAAH